VNAFGPERGWSERCPVVTGASKIAYAWKTTSIIICPSPSLPLQRNCRRSQNQWLMLQHLVCDACCTAAIADLASSSIDLNHFSVCIRPTRLKHSVHGCIPFPCCYIRFYHRLFSRVTALHETTTKVCQKKTRNKRWSVACIQPSFMVALSQLLGARKEYSD
jgi:hypothetical protein